MLRDEVAPVAAIELSERERWKYQTQNPFKAPHNTQITYHYRHHAYNVPPYKDALFHSCRRCWSATTAAAMTASTLTTQWWRMCHRYPDSVCCTHETTTTVSYELQMWTLRTSTGKSAGIHTIRATQKPQQRGRRQRHTTQHTKFCKHWPQTRCTNVLLLLNKTDLNKNIQAHFHSVVAFIIRYYKIIVCTSFCWIRAILFPLQFAKKEPNASVVYLYCTTTHQKGISVQFPRMAQHCKAQDK